MAGPTPSGPAAARARRAPAAVQAGAAGSDRRDFFISHAGADQQWAEWIGQQLIDAGFTVELDVWEWAAGTNFVDAMRAALDRADRVLAVYTDAYFDRRYAKAEHTAAFTSANPGRIVPVQVEECEVPELYAPLLRIELAGLDQDEARRRLLAGVAGPAGPPPGPVTYPGGRAQAPSQAGAVPARVEFPRRLPPVWNVPPQNPFFTGRAGLLSEIHHRLHPATGKGGAVAVVPLQGIGGVGKTQLAVEYARRHAGDYQTIWWINASDPALTTAGLVDLAAALSLPTDGPPPTVLRRLWAALSEQTDWLLIYDNADDPTWLAELRPPDGGRLLITSRNPTMARLASPIEIAGFDRTESIHLLQTRCPALSPREADQIAEALGDLPLAVEQAGCYLADTGLDVDDYLDLLASQPAEAGLADPTVDRHPGLVKVVTASVTRLTSVNPPAAALLDQLAFLAPEPLPLTPHRAGTAPARFGLRVADPATTGNIVRHITALGLARRAGTALQLHRLVRALLRARLTPAQQAESLHAAKLLLATADPGNPYHRGGHGYPWRDYEALIPHVKAAGISPPEEMGDAECDPGPFRALTLNICRYLSIGGHYGESGEIATVLHYRWSRSLGPDHPDTLRSAQELATAMSRRMATSPEDAPQRQAARALAEDTLARRRRVLGPDHPDTLWSAFEVAAILDGLVHLPAARALHQDTFARRRRVLGPDHPDTLWSALALAAAVLRTTTSRFGELPEHWAARTLAMDTEMRWRRVLASDFSEPETGYAIFANQNHAIGLNLIGIQGWMAVYKILPLPGHEPGPMTSLDEAFKRIVDVD